MLFKQAPVLQHPDAFLRPIQADDLANWAAYLRDPLVYRHTSWNLQSLAELEPYIAPNQTRQPDSALRMALACPRSNALLGTIGFHTVSSLNKSAELAYDLAPGSWGKGIATAATTAMTAWAHAHAGMIRVQATVLETNTRSMAVLARCGFQAEGLLRCYRQVRGQAGNFMMYSHILTRQAGESPPPEQETA